MKIESSQAMAIKPQAPLRKAAPEAEESARKPGRSHIQRDLKHLVRDIRHEVKDEIKSLRASGEDGAEDKIAAVKDAFHDFRDDVQGAFHDAGKGGSFTASAVPEGLRLAMTSFTGNLRLINGPIAEEGTKEPATDPTEDLAPELQVLDPGTLLNVTA